jgi:hypothetical protein
MTGPGIIVGIRSTTEQNKRQTNLRDVTNALSDDNTYCLTRPLGGEWIVWQERFHV